MEHIEDLQFGGFCLLQDTDLYRFSMDSVLLADFASVRRGERVVDLGAGCGVLDVLMYSRQPDALYQAIEIQPELYSLLERNLRLNAMDGLSTCVLGDIRNACRFFGAANDVCVCNPPFEKADAGSARLGPTQETARKETRISLDEACEAASKCLRWGGRLYMVHRAQRLADVMVAMRQAGLEPKMLRLCAGTPEKEPRQCLLMAQKGAGEGLRVLPTLVARDKDGNETAEIRRIYRREQE